MAITKTLAPTNQVITIDAFQDEKPDYRHVADAEGKLADAVNKIGNATDLGSDTLANIQAAIVTLAGNVPDNTVIPIKYTISSVSGVHYPTIYIGTLERIYGSRLIVNVRECMYANDAIIGNYKDGTWNWAQLATSDQTARRAEKRVQGGETAEFTFSSYNTSAIIFGSVGDNDAILYVYSNGYLVPVKTSSRMTVTLSSDYKTVTVSVSSGTGHVGCISANLQPTVT